MRRTVTVTRRGHEECVPSGYTYFFTVLPMCRAIKYLINDRPQLVYMESQDTLPVLIAAATSGSTSGDQAAPSTLTATRPGGLEKVCRRHPRAARGDPRE